MLEVTSVEHPDSMFLGDVDRVVYLLGVLSGNSQVKIGFRHKLNMFVVSGCLFSQY